MARFDSRGSSWGHGNRSRRRKLAMFPVWVHTAIRNAPEAVIVWICDSITEFWQDQVDSQGGLVESR